MTIKNLIKTILLDFFFFDFNYSCNPKFIDMKKE